MRKSLRNLPLTRLVAWAVLCVGVVALLAQPNARAQDTDEAEALEAKPSVLVVRWDDAITPVTRDYLFHVIEDAEERDLSAVVVELDTPGGLLDATREIVTDIFASEVPLLFWVGPTGARAASAGTFMTMAAHVAAMAPGTNIGAASPVQSGGGEMDSTMSNKMFNDTAAFARSIAERRSRNADWAEDAVRDADSISENEALEQNVIDFVAEDAEALVALAHGKVVELPEGEVTLDLEGAEIERQELGMRFYLLSLLANPNIAYILMMLGFYGLYFELSNPGTLFPGIVGAICLILAFFSLQTLPMNTAGVLLIVIGIILFFLETQITSFGLLTLGGLVSTFMGALMLFDSAVPALRLSMGVVVPVTLFSAVFFAVVAGLTVRTMRKRPTTGREGMIGEIGTVRETLAPEGVVEVHGELWNAIAPEEVSVGERVEVEKVEGLKVRVVRAPSRA